MNALETLLHAYQSVAQAHPNKDAFQITADIEDIAKRLIAASVALEGALIVKQPEG